VFLKRDIIVELDRPYITMPEAGREQPTLSVLWRVAAGLNLGTGDLATRVDKQLVAFGQPAVPDAACRRPSPVIGARHGGRLSRPWVDARTGVSLRRRP
jgi:hypothetical protein